MARYMIAITILIGIFGLLTAPAQALSCVAPTPESSFERYDAAEEYYQIFTGTLRPLEPVPQASGYTETPNPQTVLFRFTGQALTADNRRLTTQSFDVEVTPGCAGPWCAGYPDSSEHIYFFGAPETRGSRLYTYSPTACPGSQFSATFDNRQRLQKCLSGRCDPTDRVEPIPQPPIPPQPTPSCGAAYLSELIDLHISDIPRLFQDNRFTRIIRPGDIVTKDYRLDRLNIELDNRDIVTTLRCG